MMQVVLGNADHPEYGVATIPFPIPKDQYDHCMEMMEALEIGDPHKKDCKVQAIDSFYSVLKITENLRVNLDELDYLAKRLESFDDGEAAQFQAMASKLELFELKDFINLTFCCQQATVITDFSDLKAVGRDHYMNTHGGCASVQALEELDGEETAILLIDSGGGTVTRYGVVYDNGMELDQSYDGKHFPAYLYEPPMLMVALTSSQEPEDTNSITWLYLPAAKGQIERAMARSGIADPEDMRFRFAESMFSDEVDAALDFQCESIFELNELAQAVDIINFFGDMEICTSQGILREKDFNSPKSSRVVTYLMLNRRAAHPPLAIHSALWQDDNTDPDAIGSNIRGCIYRFRQAFALISKHPLIESTTGGYRINPELNIMTDIDQFERLTKAAQQAVSVSQRVSLLKQAVELYRGPLYKAASDEHWIIGQVNHYRIQYASLVNELLTELAAAKDYTCVHHYAQMSIRIMPGNLRVYYWLIISLCYIGTLDLARQEWMRAKEALTVEEHEALTAMLKQSEEFSAQELKT